MIKLNSIPKKHIICSVWKNTFPHRNKNSKWYVTFKEYPEDLYPDYCGGFFFLMTNDIIGPLHNEMFYTKFFWIDDVWLTGIAIKEINVTLECRKDMIVEQEEVEKRFIDVKSVKQTFGGHLGKKTDKITELWNCLYPLYLNAYYFKKSKEKYMNEEMHIQLILFIFILIYFLFLKSKIKLRKFHI